MEFQKIVNSLDITFDDKNLFKKESKFMIDKKKNCSINEEIRIKTPMLRSDSRDLIILSVKHNSIV